MADDPWSEVGGAVGAEIAPEYHDERVVKFHPQIVGESYRFDPDQILEEAKGRGFTNVLIIGELDDGELWVSSAANAGEALVLMEKAKHKIVFGDE